jgi:hypothetical protein
MNAKIEGYLINLNSTGVAMKIAQKLKNEVEPHNKQGNVWPPFKVAIILEAKIKDFKGG